MRKWQRGRSRRRRGPADGAENAGAAPPLQPIIPESLPDDIGNRVEPEPSAESDEENFNRYPAEIEQRQRQQPGGGGGGGGRGRRGRGGRDRNQPQPQPQAPRGEAAAQPPAPAQPPAEQPVAPPGAAAPGAQGEGGGGRRRRRKRGGRGRGERAPEPTISRDASGSGALVPNYPEERFESPQQPQPMSEVAPELPAARTEPPPQQPRAATPRKPRGVVVLAIGLPGSGKSSWFKRRGVTPLSSDVLRNLLFDDITEQRYQDLVFSTLRSLLRARMIARMPWNYLDATNLNPRERHGWIKMAREFGYEVHAVFFDVPVEVCTERNLKRNRVVPDEVMQRMAQKLRPPTFEEGFSKIIVVRVKRRNEEPTSEIQGEPETGEAEDVEEGLEET